VNQKERPVRYFAQDESRFGLKTITGRLVGLKDTNLLDIEK